MTGGPPIPAYTGVTALRHAAVLGGTAASPAERCPAGSASGVRAVRYVGGTDTPLLGTGKETSQSLPATRQGTEAGHLRQDFV